MDGNIKQSDEKRANKSFLVFIVLLSVVLLVQLLIIIKTAAYSRDGGSIKEIVINSVETPVTDIVYNMEAVDSLKVRINQDEPYDVTFLASVGEIRDIELFTFYFGDNTKGSALGFIKDKAAKRIKVSVDKTAFESLVGLSALDKTKFLNTQEELLDIIISNIEFEEIIFHEETDTTKSEYLEIETPYANLLFSKEWEKYLVVEHINGNPYQVKFYCKLPDKEAAELFTYSFGSGADFVIGYLKDTEIGLTEGTTEADSTWTEDERAIFYMMKEEMNTIIDGLVDTEGFMFTQ